MLVCLHERLGLEGSKEKEGFGLKHIKPYNKEDLEGKNNLLWIC